jgi:uncharacterized protein
MFTLAAPRMAMPPRAFRGVAKALSVLAFALVALFSPVRAMAFTPPTMDGAVTDRAKVLSESDVRALKEKLKRYKAGSGNQIAIYIPAGLDGEDIKDVAYETFQAWKLGAGGADNGVLLVWSPKDRKVRIEVGKGLGGQLTDVESFRIIRDVISPRLKAGKNREALDAGTDAIMAALGGRSSTANAPPVGAPGASKKGSVGLGVGIVAVIILVLGFLFILFVISRILSIFRGPSTPNYHHDRDHGAGIFFMGGGGGGYNGGGGGSGGGGNDSSWGDSGGYDGGGGESGGGGSDDSY